MAAAKKKVVLLLDLHENDAKEKRKVLKAVSAFPGLDLIAVDMKERKLTVVGLVDAIELVAKLRKLWYAEILFVGPAKEDKATAGNEHEREGGAGGVKEEGDKGNHQEVTTANKQVERTAADVRSWPHAPVYVYPPRPRDPYPYQPHRQYVAHGRHGAQETNPHSSYVAYGHGLQEDHGNSYYVTGRLGAQDNHPNSYAAYGHGARENHPSSYYVAHGGHGAQEQNGCAIC